MKRKLVFLLILANIILATACKNDGSGGMMTYNGKSYPSIFIESGYYFDKASLSELTLGDMLVNIKTVKKPKYLGEVELPNLKEITLYNNPEVEITDEMIEAEIEKVRDKEVEYAPLKTRRPAKLKDRVTVDFKGFVDGAELDGGSGEDYSLVLGAGQFIEGFEEGIVGHSAGSKFSINVVFPEGYSENLSSKPATFEILIKMIEEPITPEVDKAFIIKHSETGATTIEQYREEIKESIKERNFFMNNSNLIYQLTEILIEECKFTPTEEALAWQFSAEVARNNNEAVQQGTTFPKLLKENGFSIVEAYEEMKSIAPSQIRYTMLVDKLSEIYPTNITDDDVKAFVKKYIAAMGYDKDFGHDDFVKQFGEDIIKSAVKEEKIFLAAAHDCNIVDEEEEEQ